MTRISVARPRSRRKTPRRVIHQSHLKETIMVTVIWKESKGTAKSRYKARREELIAERRSSERLTRKIALKISGCVRADKAVSLSSLRNKKAEEVERKNRSTYYKDSNPLGNKIHAVQKIKLYSKPPYGLIEYAYGEKDYLC